MYICLCRAPRGRPRSRGLEKNPRPRGFESILGLDIEDSEQSLASALRLILGRGQFEAKSRPGEENNQVATEIFVKQKGQKTVK